MAATDQSRKPAREASRHNCMAIQKTLAAVISLRSAKLVSSRLTLMLPSTGLSSASALICHMG